MQTLGQVLVAISFVLTALIVLLSLRAALSSKAGPAFSLSHGTFAIAYLNLAASLVLAYSFVSHDFSNRYVASYSDSSMPAVYLLTAFWAGEKGALMFWVLVLSGLLVSLEHYFRGLFAQASGHLPSFSIKRYFNVARAVGLVALLFFEFLMLFASHPFETFLTSEGPQDGAGMNPLLQNPLMAVHPPFQLAGFVAYTIPYAFSVAALVVGDLSDLWVRIARRFSLLAWSLLTAGLIIGGLWAYVELGWGGFWGWDPVENGALLPWLTGTALLHSMAVEVRRSALRRLNHILMHLTFILTIFATFLTRSQLISSLHAFANSVLTPYFLYYMGFLVMLAIVLIAWRWKALCPKQRIGSLFTREALVVVNNVAFLLMLFIVLWGTLLPRLSESPAVQSALNKALAGFNAVFSGEFTRLEGPISVGPEWFNKVTAPVGLFILALTAFGPLVPYGEGGRRAVNRAILKTALYSATATIGVLACFAVLRGLQTNGTLDLSFGHFSLEHLYAILGVFLATWVAVVAARDFVISVAARRAVTRLSRLRTFCTLLRDNPRRYGGHLVHIGVALCFMSFAGSAAKQEKKDVLIGVGQSIGLGHIDLTLLSTYEACEGSGRYCASVSEVLAWPKGQSLPDSVLKKLEGVSGVVEVRQMSPPWVGLRFSSPKRALEYLAETYARVVLGRDFILVNAEEGQLHLAPAAPEALRLQPRNFHRLLEQLHNLEAWFGPGNVTIQTRRGDPLVVLTFQNKDLFEAFRRGLTLGTDEGVALLVLDPSDRNVIRVIPSGIGTVLRPEVRFYTKFENPTTEVDIWSHLFFDLYIAAAPASGTNTVSVTAMINPLMTWLWAGSFLLVFVGLLLSLSPTPKSAGYELAMKGVAEMQKGQQTCS